MHLPFHEELDYLKELTNKLREENKSLVNDNKKLKKQLKVQAEDREFLIQQLIASKKDVQRLKNRLDEATQEEKQ